MHRDQMNRVASFQKILQNLNSIVNCYFDIEFIFTWLAGGTTTFAITSNYIDELKNTVLSYNLSNFLCIFQVNHVQKYLPLVSNRCLLPLPPLNGKKKNNVNTF